MKTATRYLSSPVEEDNKATRRIIHQFNVLSLKKKKLIWCLESVYLWYLGRRTRWCCWRAPWTTTTTTYSARYIMERCGFAVCWCGSWINRFYILISLSVKCISFQKSELQTDLLTYGQSDVIEELRSLKVDPDPIQIGKSWEYILRYRMVLMFLVDLF